jgi:hypothetical protein
MMIEALIMLGIAILSSLVWLWAGGIDYMKKNHPDYKGEDFFNEEDKNETQ